MRSIRLAEAFDGEAITAFDEVALCNDNRAAFIRRSITSRNCYVATADEITIGYAVLEYSFYENGFIAMLYVHPAYRRAGVGTELVRHLERLCRTPKLFTSTNQSNAAMQSLLEKLGYAPSGVINNLDEGDPELVYFRRLNASTT